MRPRLQLSHYNTMDVVSSGVHFGGVWGSDIPHEVREKIENSRGKQIVIRAKFTKVK